MAEFNSVRSFLERLGLEGYLDSFESNQIGVKELSSLTNEDLKELGITNLGHRKAILAELQSLTATPTEKKPVSTEETVFFEASLALVNSELAAIKITNRRAVLGDKTYALQNIAAVEAWSNESEIAETNKTALEQWKATNSLEAHQNGKVASLISAAVFAAFGIYFLVDESMGGAGCCGALAVAAVFAALQPPKFKPQPEPQKALWKVRIQASGTSSDVVASFDREKIQATVKALNDAIVNLNM